MRDAVESVTQSVPVSLVCSALDFSRSSLYRLRKAPTRAVKQPRRSSRALTVEEKEAVRQVLNSERFCDLAPRQVYGTLLDEGEYLCSISSMYRIMSENAEVKERRRQRVGGPRCRRLRGVGLRGLRRWLWSGASVQPGRLRRGMLAWAGRLRRGLRSYRLQSDPLWRVRPNLHGRSGLLRRPVHRGVPSR